MTTWAHAPGVLWRRSAGRVVVDLPDGEEPLLLEGPGARAWELCATPRDGEELCAVLAREYGESPETVTRDLEPLLERLGSAGALTCR